ncbi:uncharacterized protein METZ01_LOCUS144812 [marine metagenome]|uniref:Uncharacterized protein n=1 Tax=marine metagenome TaxID=408172 RepID=A0A381ZRQ0_9ZZZZ
MYLLYEVPSAHSLKNKFSLSTAGVSKAPSSIH